MAHLGGAFDEHAPLVEELVARIRDRRPAPAPRRGRARGDRLVLAADEPGPGHPGGPRRVGSPRDRPAAGQPPHLRPCRAPLPGRAPRRAPPGVGATPASPAVALPRRRAAGHRRPVRAVVRQRPQRGGADGAQGGAHRARRDRSGRPSRASRASGSSSPPSSRSSTQAEREVAAGEPPGGVDPGVAFLAPLDPFCWDRDLMRRLFDFDYVWEVYVPAAKRRWGYYVLPILFGDRLVGRIEPRIERRAGTLRIAGLWWEAGFDPLETTASRPPSPRPSPRTGTSAA